MATFGNTLSQQDIEKHRDYLVKKLQLEKIAEEMIAIRVLTPKQYETLMEKNSKIARMRGFLDLLFNLSHLPIAKFLTALKKSGYSTVVNFLEGHGVRFKNNESPGMTLVRRTAPHETDSDVR